MKLDPVRQEGVLQALHVQREMAALNKFRLAANFIVKGAEQKTYATSSLTAFSLDQVGSGDRRGGA